MKIYNRKPLWRCQRGVKILKWNEISGLRAITIYYFFGILTIFY